MKHWLLLSTLLLASPVSAAPWQPFTALAVSADGRWLATGGWGGEVLQWEASTGEVVGRWTFENDRPIAGLIFTKHGLEVESLRGPQRVIDSTGAVKITSSSEGPATKQWRESSPMSGVTAGTVKGTADGKITIVAAGSSVVWQAHDAAVTGLVLSPDRRFLYSCAFDGTLAVWDFATGKLVFRL